MNKQVVFSYVIRCVFLFAFIAFLSASISHVATFFNDFEADKSNWIEPYMLAISIDLTALVLTVGVMFFRKQMPWYAVVITWLFIIGLTAFSWTVNFEYAQTFQGKLLHTNDTLSMLNPILASSFAFFNLVYSFVSEFFSMKVQTADELQKELERLEALETVQNRMKEYKERNKKKSFIQSAKETLIEAKEAVIEVKNGTAETALEEDEEEILVDMAVDIQIDELPSTPEPLPVDILPFIPRPRTTDKLAEAIEEDSGQKSRQCRSTSNDSVKRKKVERLLRKNPGISSTQLAEKAGVSRSYAGQIKKQMEA